MPSVTVCYDFTVTCETPCSGSSLFLEMSAAKRITFVMPGTPVCVVCINVSNSKGWFKLVLNSNTTIHNSNQTWICDWCRNQLKRMAMDTTEHNIDLMCCKHSAVNPFCLFVEEFRQKLKEQHPSCTRFRLRKLLCVLIAFLRPPSFSF